MKRIVFFLFCMLFSFSFSAPGKDRSFFFVQLSDPRLGLCSEDGGFEREKQQFKQFIDAINRLKPAFVVISGNLVNDRGNAATGRVPGVVPPDRFENPDLSVAGRLRRRGRSLARSGAGFYRPVRQRSFRFP